MSVTRHLDPTDFHNRNKMGLINCSVQNILFCVQLKKEINSGLKQLECEQMTEFKFLGELFL